MGRIPAFLELAALERAAAAWLDWMGPMSWQVALLVVVLFGVALLARKASPRFRYFLWCLVLVKLCLPPSIAFVTGIGRWLPAAPAPRMEARVEPLAPSIPPPGIAPIAPLYPAEESVVAAPPAAVETAIEVASPAEKSSLRISWRQAVFAVWIAGVLGMAGAVFSGYWRVRRRLSRCVPVEDPGILAAFRDARERLGIRGKRIRLLASPDRSSPILLGLLRPRIVIPSDALEKLPQEQLRPILLHELAHVRRRDLWVNWIQVILQALYWFHPFVWLANMRLRREREMIVDDLVLAHLEGGHETYGTSLLNILKQAVRRRMLAPGYIGIIETRGSLVARLRRILDANRKLSVRLGWLSAAVILALALILIPQAQSKARAAAVAEKAKEIASGQERHYVCEWYLIGEVGTGNGGGVAFLEEDANGNIWTSAGPDGSSSIWQFDGQNWHRRYKVEAQGSSIWSAGFDKKEGGMFFATDQGLLHLQDNLWELHTQMSIVHGFGPSTFHHLAKATFNAVPTKLTHADRRGDVWVYSPNIGLFRRTGPYPGNWSQGRIWNEHTTYWPSDGGRTKLINLIGNEPVTCIHAPDAETVLVGTEAGSIWVLREKPSKRHAAGTDVELDAQYPADAIGIAAGVRINAIVTDDKGRVWIAYGKDPTEGGVARLEGGRWKVYNHANSLLPARPVTAIACVGSDRIWAGVDWKDPSVSPSGHGYDKTGLLELSGEGWKYVECEGFQPGIMVLDRGPGQAEERALYNQCYRWITFIRPDSRGNIWVGTQGGLARFVHVQNVGIGFGEAASQELAEHAQTPVEERESSRGSRPGDRPKTTADIKPATPEGVDGRILTEDVIEDFERRNEQEGGALECAILRPPRALLMRAMLGGRLDDTRAKLSLDEAEIAAERQALAEMIIPLIRENVQPDAWKSLNVNIRVKEARFLVFQRPEVIERIRTYLRNAATLLPDANTRVRIVATVLDVEGPMPKKLAALLPKPAPTTGARPSAAIPFLSAPQIEALLKEARKSKKISFGASPALTALNDEKAVLFLGQSESYVKWRASHLSDSDKRDKEARGTVEPGVRLTCRPRVSEDKKHITLSVEMRVASVDRWIQHESAVGTIRAPVVSTKVMQTTVRLPNGGGAYWSGVSGEGASSLFLVSAEIVDAKNPGDAAASAETGAPTTVAE